MPANCSDNPHAPFPHPASNGSNGHACSRPAHPLPSDRAQHPDSEACVDRRSGLDRRDFPRSAGAETDNTGAERRRGPGRRRSDFTKSAEEGEMTPEQFLFVLAIDTFKKANQRMYPTWTDVLEVVRLLGYRKTQPTQIAIRGAEDWKESPDAPHGVRARPGHPEAGERDRRDGARRAA